MLGFSAWVLWAFLAGVFAIGEVFTPGLFFLGPLALAALVAVAVAAVGGGVLGVLAFAAASVFCVVVLRPLARRHLRLPVASRTGAAALVGRKALVLDRVDGSGGRVKIGGEEWSARAFLEGAALEAGEGAEVAAIEGATALVL